MKSIIKGFILSMTFLLTSIQIGAQTPVIPNDPYFQYQVPLHNTGQTIDDTQSNLLPHTGTPDADIDLPEAWYFTMGSPDVTVAVIDKGVIRNHPDLDALRIRVVWEKIYNSDGSIEPAFYNTWPIGDDAHGTAVAGVIAATANNGKGIVGVAPNCKILPFNTFKNLDGSEVQNYTTDNVKQWIDKAVKMGCNVINLSLGVERAYYDDYMLGQLHEKIRWAINKGCVVVAAAGNFANHVKNNDGYVDPMVRLDIPGLLVVGASDRYDQQADYSPTSEYINIVAPSSRGIFPVQGDDYPGMPGEYDDMWVLDIPGNAGDNPCNGPGGGFSLGTTSPNSGIDYLDYSSRFGGTSYACAIVSGVAALVASCNPNLTPQEICSIITGTADKIGPYIYVNGRSLETGYGRVNAEKAVWEAIRISEIQFDTITNNRTEYCNDLTIQDVFIKHTANNNPIVQVRNKGIVSIERNFNVEKNTVFEVKPFAWE